MNQLSPSEERILLRLSHAILGPVDPPPEATGFLRTVDGMLAELPASDRRGIRAVLRLLHWSPLFLLRGWTFDRLGEDRREELLRKLGISRVGFLRRAVAVVRSIVVYSYYGQKESWASIGYGGPWIGRREIEALADPDLTPPGDGEGRGHRA